jgi:ADP-ribose pyrophosphatase YjhB (NUDIX family)
MQYSAGAVVVGPGNKIVVVNQNNNSWSLPKGHLEGNEDEEAAAIREVFEESGIQDVKILEKLGEYERTTISLDGKGEQLDNIKHITIFLGITNQTELSPIDPNNPEAKWIALQDVADLLTHPKDKEFFSSITPKLLRFFAD